MSEDHIERKAVEAQLNRILADATFSSAARLSSFLRFIVAETLAGRSDQLKEYSLGVAVFGRGTRFDPRVDSIVRVEASKLRARLASYYKDAGAKDLLRIDLPRGSYVPQLLPNRHLADASPSGVLAVLPFVYLGSEVEGEYFSDGLTEEVIDALGTIPGARIVARTSSFQFKGKSAGIQELASALGAAYLVEGSVRKLGKRVRVNARLIEASSGCRIWSNSWDRQSDDLFGLQIAIAENLAAAFGARLPDLRAEPVSDELSAEAYRAYLRGRFHRNQWTLEGFQKSVESLQQALQLNPHSARILAALSEVQINQALLSGLVPTAKPIESARAYAERALRIDDRCAQAHLALGWIRQLCDWDFDLALAEFDQALTLCGSFAEALHLKSLALAVRRRPAEAEEALQRALEADPLSRIIQSHLALIPYFSDDLDTAEVRIRAALHLDPSFAEPHWILGLIEERQGHYAQAMNSLRTAIELGGENPVILGDLAYVCILGGDVDGAHQLVARLQEGYPRPHPAASNLARVYLGLGDENAANVWLTEAFEARDFMLPWACADRRYEKMWRMPAFSGFRNRVLGAAAVG